VDVTFQFFEEVVQATINIGARLMQATLKNFGIIKSIAYFKLAYFNQKDG
jgi:hypothetical protein